MAISDGFKLFRSLGLTLQFSGWCASVGPIAGLVLRWNIVVFAPWEANRVWYAGTAL